jgi:basic membrane protein A
LRNALKIAAALAAGALVLTGCGSSSSEAAPAGTPGATQPESSAPTSTIKVGMAYDVGGRGDKSFNDAAAAGLDKAKSEFGVQTQELEATNGETDAQKEERLRTLADGGFNPIIAVGFAYSGPVGKVAKEYPDVNFAIIDDAANDLPNLANLTFAEEQGSFLVGVIAAQASKTGSVGFIGGVNVPLLQKFQAGFDAGAKAQNPSIKLQDKYLTEPPDFGGFNDPAKGKTSAKGMYDKGADVVFAAAGGSGTGVFEAAKAAGALAIGVDSDQYLTAAADVKDVILTSMIKKVDVAVYEFIKSAVDGSTFTGNKVFDLAAGGVGYSTSNPAVEPYTAKADEFAQKIISGEIKVPTTP